MGKRRTTDLRLGVFAVVIIGITLLAAPFVYSYLTGDGGSIIPPPPPDGAAPHTFVLYKEGTTTAVASASVYAWYDWDGDGEVDIGAYGDGDGEIETLTSAATTGVVTTAVEYPLGKAVQYQIQASGYEVMTFSRVRNSVPVAWDGSALAVTNCFIRASADGTGYASHAVNGTLTTAAVYSGNDYGDEFTLNFRVVSNTTDSGFGESEYYDWSTGKHYTGSFLGITMTNQDAIDANPSGYDQRIVGASNTYFIFWIGSHFDDAGEASDGTFNIADIAFDMSATFNFTANFFSGIEWDNAMIGVWGSTYEVIGCGGTTGAGGALSCTT